jgi:PAS domain S-box-containing protein
MSGINQDITEHKRAEEALKESEKKFHEIFNKANDAIHLHEIGKDGRPGKFIDINEVACEKLQYSRDEMLQRGPLDITTEYHSRPLDTILEELRTVGHATFETGHIRKDGTIVPVEVNTHVITLFGRDVVLGVVRDITNRKKVEEALRESERKFRNFFETSHDAVFITSTDGKLVDVNESFIDMFGYDSREEILTVKVADLYANPDERDKHIRTIAEMGHTKEYPVNLRKKDGTIINTLISSVPWKDAGGRVIGFQGTLRDITERRQVEEDLHKMSTAIAEANKKLNLLSSITRHDILNQLTALQGYLELSHDSVSDPETLLSFIEKEETAAAMIADQITFTREYQDLGVSAPVWQNVNESIKNAVVGLPMRDIRVEVDRTDLEIFADPLFGKVFYNLIDNALRYGGAGMKTIRVSSQESEHGLTIVCENDGVGISDEEQKHLFTRGFGKHTGLGLFLTREILGITGITIAENGIPGKGARFEITVPKGEYRCADAGKK